MLGAIELQQAGADHLDDAVLLLERFFTEETFDTPVDQVRPRLAALLGREDSAVFLARLGGRAVGVATVTASMGVELGLSAEMEDLYVLPEARGKGAGSALITAVRQWCASRCCSLVAVLVTPEGQAAHNLVAYYRSRGFRETGKGVAQAQMLLALAASHARSRHVGGPARERAELHDLTLDRRAPELLHSEKSCAAF